MSSFADALVGPQIAHYVQLVHLDNPLNLLLLLTAFYLAMALIVPAPVEPPTIPLPTSPAKSYNWRPAPLVTGQDVTWWRKFTPKELAPFDGRDMGLEGGRILMGIRRKVYDVSSGRSFYGPDGPYATFAGRDASRGLAKQSFERDMLTVDLDGPIDSLEDLTKGEWEGLRDWESHFMNKYFMCGDLVEAKQ